MSKPTVYPLSASRFLTWATHPRVQPKIRGIIEHYVHHLSVIKYHAVDKLKTSCQANSHAENWFCSESMPELLRQSRAVMSEMDIAVVYKDLRLIGRVDQLYQYCSGEQSIHILVDTKSHRAVTFRDQLQLSFYAYILSSKGYKMSDTAYIRASGVEVAYLDVELIPFEAMREVLDSVE